MGGDDERNKSAGNFLEHVTLLYTRLEVSLDISTFIVSRRLRKAWKRSNTILG